MFAHFELCGEIPDYACGVAAATPILGGIKEILLRSLQVCFRTTAVHSDVCVEGKRNEAYEPECGMNRRIATGWRKCASCAATLALAAANAHAQNVAATPVSEARAAPITVTLDEAIERARANDPGYATAVADSGSAALDRSISRSALLPGVTYHNQYLYTQPNGTRNSAGQTGSQSAPRFIASNAIREYASQVQATETIGLAQVADYKRAGALATKAAAQLEIARRGLVAAVVDGYFSLLAADRKLATTERAAAEAQNFDSLTQKREAGREVAHADVVKADLQSQQRQRDLADARLAASKARLDLGVLLFPDPRTNYRLGEDGGTPPVPTRTAVEDAASHNNPDLRSALAALRASDLEVEAARAAYLPDISLNYSYGIDAPQFAVNGPDGVRNLGYSAFATLDIPVWDWFATHDRVKQSQLRQTAARTALTFAQKHLIAKLDELYDEAATANSALTSLDLSAQTAAESLRLTNLRYQAGEATALEVVDAQNALTSAEMSRADGVVRYRLALANLQTLTGAL
jgi:outer membrane protein TolC